MLYALVALVALLAGAEAQGTAGPFQVNPCECLRCFAYPKIDLRSGVTFQKICQTLIPKACPITEVFDVPDTVPWSRYAQVNPIPIEFVTIHLADSGVVPGQVYGVKQELCNGFQVVGTLSVEAATGDIKPAPVKV